MEGVPFEIEKTAAIIGVRLGSSQTSPGGRQVQTSRIGEVSIRVNVSGLSQAVVFDGKSYLAFWYCWVLAGLMEWWRRLSVIACRIWRQGNNAAQKNIPGAVAFMAVA